MPERPLEPEIVSELHNKHRAQLERFAWAILRDWSLAADAVQNAFMALGQFGGDVAPEAYKSWLFKVVHRESFRIRNSQGRQTSNIELGQVAESHAIYHVTPDSILVDAEESKRIKSLIEGLPEDQQRIIQLKIFDGKTFAEISDLLQIPLGTALSRMRLALHRLRSSQNELHHDA